MEEVVAGINEEELSALSIEVLDYAGRISEILDRIDASMEKLPSCYRGHSCDLLMERYDVTRSSFSVIKENIVTYSDDFIMLINKMRDNDKYLSSLFQGLTDDVNSRKRLINATK